MKNNLIKIGVLGAGHLGQHHIKHLKVLKDSHLVGFYDSDISRAKEISKSHNVKCYKNPDDLIRNVDALSIVVPTNKHYKVAKKCIKNKKHVFIEKPITSSLEEADELILLGKKNKVLIQVGHIERINPALIALNKYKIKPEFVEIQRLAPYTSRGTDVPVVLDKMIHDIDILLSLVKAPVHKTHATGVSILTNSVDIAHARITFENNTVASVMSSRVSQDEVRKIKIFQKNLYAILDLLNGSTEIYEITPDKIDKKSSRVYVPYSHNKKNKFIAYHKPILHKVDPLALELKNFVESIRGKEKPIVPGIEGRNALNLALQIQKIIINDIK